MSVNLSCFFFRYHTTRFFIYFPQYTLLKNTPHTHPIMAHVRGIGWFRHKKSCVTIQNDMNIGKLSSAITIDAIPQRTSSCLTASSTFWSIATFVFKLRKWRSPTIAALFCAASPVVITSRHFSSGLYRTNIAPTLRSNSLCASMYFVQLLT